jgi:hypothetical protein
MLIPPTDNPALDQALADKLATIKARGGSLGMLDSLAMLPRAIQNSLTPRIGTASLVLVAADHGLAAADRGLAPSTAETIAALHPGRLPLAARLAGESGGKDPAAAAMWRARAQRRELLPLGLDGRMLAIKWLSLRRRSARPRAPL